jgi:peptidoglycan/LPS O-acetylase OafA/YrhL
MTSATSLFLDFLRVVAAFGVVLVHTAITQFSPVFALGPDYGHRFVIVFFVLSGYVISFSTFSRAQTAQNYAIARLSRLYSVLVPALLISAILLLIGRSINPDFYARLSRGHEVLRFGLSLTFFNEMWAFSAAPPTNTPLWSLAYEFWYYAIFGVWVFARQRISAVLLSLGIAALIGPKIILLLPVWLLGVATERFGTRFRIPPGIALTGLVGVLVALTIASRRLGSIPGEVGYPLFYFSNAWASDFVLGTLVAALILCFQHASVRWSFPAWLGAPIRHGANLTFSLYLLHYPILVFLAATLPYDHASRMTVALLLIGLLLIVALISAVTEARRRNLADCLRRAFNFKPGEPSPR